MRLDDGQELGPRDECLHAGEELFPTGGLLFGGKLGMGKRGLVNYAIHDGLARRRVQNNFRAD
jgi:hypothetical protein